MDSKIKKELIEQYSFYEIRDLLCECVRKHMNEIDTDKVYELCDKIKQLMEEQSRTQLILKSADIYRDSLDDDDDDDDVNYEEDIDEDIYCDYSMDCETRLVSYDCGGYSRALQLGGVVIEDDEMFLYLIEVEMSNKGNDDRECYVESIKDFMNERNWWWSNNMPEVMFRPIEALEYYVYLLTDKESPLFEEN